MIGWLSEQGRVFVLAAQFLTRLPLPAELGYTPARMAKTPRYYPAVGLLVGGIGALVYALGALALPPALSALLAVSATVLATGAFHEDGLADVFDGIGGGVTRERALEIMKDSRLGTYGALALGLVVAAQILGLAALPAGAAMAVLVAGHGLSRLSAVAVIATGRYARDHGTGKPVAAGLGVADAGIAGLTGLGIIAALIAAIGPQAALCGLIGLIVGHGAMRAMFEAKLGGYTGDCLGAVQQVSAVGLILGVAIWL